MESVLQIVETDFLKKGVFANLVMLIGIVIIVKLLQISVN